MRVGLEQQLLAIFDARVWTCVVSGRFKVSLLIINAAKKAVFYFCNLNFYANTANRLYERELFAVGHLFAPHQRQPIAFFSHTHRFYHHIF